MFGSKYSKFAMGLVAFGAALTMGSANAATITIDVGGIDSFGGYGESGNTIITALIGANAEVTGVTYDVTLEAFSPSWLSEITVDFTDSAETAGVALRPGFEDALPGVGSYSDTANLTDLGLNFNVGADGQLRLQFYEGFDDASVAPDGKWLSGTLTFEVSALAVPEPSTYALMAFGLAGLGAVARRRKAG